ncbi:MAG: radical SAM family heme chaperone HemW [Myxococcales bacterium]|nr:radical SAM family heme chaperone HemW [Myxococcales bacterium]
MPPVPPLHAYVHFPWCLEKCPYCDFVSFKTARPAIDHEGYADAVIRELRARAPFFAGHTLRSLFFGGGTPSLWAPAALGRVVDALRDAFPLADDFEVTAECNPSSFDADVVGGLSVAGVHRFSIGVQSLDGAQLKHLGRLHGIEGALASVEAAVKSGARVSADLIFGLPDQSPGEAAEHAGALVDLGLDHLSAYALTIEPGTRFGELARRGRLPLATDDATCDAFLAVEAALAARGLEHYEVSNYARPGQESRHNLGYWRGAAYIGLGCAAVGCGHFAGTPASAVRYRNDTDPARYVQKTRALAVAEPSDADGLSLEHEHLDAETLLRERIMLGLRLAEGLDLAAAAVALGLSPDEVWSTREVTIERMSRDGDLVVEGTTLKVARDRRLRTDGLAARLF